MEILCRMGQPPHGLLQNLGGCLGGMRSYGTGGGGLGECQTG